MSQKIVLKVSITGDRCKTNVMKTAAKLCGIKSLTLDADKNTLTVVGDVDVVWVVSALRRAKATVEVVSVGPEKEEKKEEKKDEKKDDKKDEKKPEPKPCEPPKPCCGCNACRQIAYGNVLVYEDQPNGCTIL